MAKFYVASGISGELISSKDFIGYDDVESCRAHVPDHHFGLIVNREPYSGQSVDELARHVILIKKVGKPWAGLSEQQEQSWFSLWE